MVWPPCAPRPGGAFCPFGPAGVGADVLGVYGIRGGLEVPALFGIMLGYYAALAALGLAAFRYRMASRMTRSAPAAPPGRGGAGSLLPGVTLALLGEGRPAAAGRGKEGEAVVEVDDV